MLKRGFDLVLTIPAAILFAPVLLIIAVLVKIKLRAPIFFVQPRPGRQALPFRMVKFRSMTDARDAAGNLLPDDARLPPFGRWLRKTSLDELPELWNVIKGDMSLVGPRPLLVEYVPLYSPEQARRHEVRPGITGWAQVNGRNAITWEQKFAYDIWYIDNWSIWLDIKIVLKTLRKVAKGSDVAAEGSATMPKFSGRSSCQSP